MSLKLVCGRSGSGKSTYILKEMEKDSKPIYIVPEQHSFSAEKKLIEVFGAVGLDGPQVLSFMRLADHVFSKYGSPEFISDGASYEMLVSYCANCVNPEKLRLFDGLVKRNELSQTASTLITTFKRYCISPGMLQNAIEKTEDELLKKKLSDSLIVYNQYLNELREANIHDQNDKLSALANVLADDNCDFLSGRNVYIDQFSDFDPSECECIKVMLKKCDKVTVALCSDFGEEFETVNRTLKKLQILAKEVGTQIEPLEELSSAMYGAKPMIRHLEHFYFDDNPALFAGTDDSIQIFCGKDRKAEVHYIAREIVKLVRDKNMRFRDIAIIARDAELYKKNIERIFPFYDIPLFVDSKMPLSGHSITVFITSILEIALSGFTYENIFAYVKSPFSPLNENEADLLENYCLAAGIRPYSWGKPFSAVARTYDNDSSAKKDLFTAEKLVEINILREKVYNPLCDLVSKLRKKSAVNTFCTLLFDFFESIKLEEKIKLYSIMLEENGENLFALQTMQVYNILIDIFDDICAVLGEKELSLREFHTTITAGLQAVEIGTIPTSSDCVTIGSIDRIKGHGAKVIFLAGVNSGIFPAAPAENGFFTDDDKKALESCGIEMPPTLEKMAQNEQLLIYEALTCAGEKLYICYASSDSTSAPLLPSEIVDRVRSLFPDISFKEDIVTEPSGVDIITAKKAVFDILLSKIRAFEKEGKPLSDELRAAAYYFSKDETFSRLLYYAVNMTGYTNEAAAINPDLMEKALGKEGLKTSISRLEAYNKCPFSYFAKYILKLEPKQKFEISVSDSGSFLHDFLDRFSTLVVSSTDESGAPLTWAKVDNDFIKINTPKILEEILCGVNERMLEIPRINALFKRLCRTAEQSLYAVRHHIVKSDFIPMGYEISFDENGDFKPIKLKLDDGKEILLRGRIDRADTFDVNLADGSAGKFVRIVDYKSTDKSLSLSDVYNGIQLQLFVYLSALCTNGYSPAGILYCNLSDPIVEVSPEDSEEDILTKRNSVRRMGGIVLSENNMLEHMGGNDTLKTKKAITAKNFNSMFRHLNRVIKRTAENIYAGKYPIECQKNACDYCDYKGLCLFDNAFSGCRNGSTSTLKDNEIWEILEKEARDNEMD